jgi:ribose transport system permease protein
VVGDKGVYIALGVVLAFNLLFTPNFASVNSLRLQLIQVIPVLIVALGMALVIGTGGIDLSVGAVMALSAAVIPVFLDQGAAVAIAMGIFAGALAGLLNGFLVAVVRVQPIVATLGLFVAGRGIALVIANGRLVEIFDLTFRLLAFGTVGPIPISVLVAVALALVTGVVVQRTVFGLRLMTIGGNPTAAMTAGLPVRRTLILAYVLCSTFAAIAGLIVTARSSASDPSFVGLLIELNAVTAVVVGGTPLTGGRIKVMGTVAGALLMQLIFATLIRHDLSDSDARMVQAAIIIAAVYLQRKKAPG